MSRVSARVEAEIRAILAGWPEELIQVFLHPPVKITATVYE